MISAQPAEGETSPRLFFLLPKLVVSAVPSGPGSRVVELGEWVTTSRTIKGELELPVPRGLAPTAAFDRVLDAQRSGTTCRGCHRTEEPYPGLEGAFASEAFEPEPGDFVTVAQLAQLHDACARDADRTPRCALLHAVFDLGEVVQGEFGPDVGTFFFR